MFITRKHLSRRTFVRGTGAALALPLLDAMVPALTAQLRTAAAPVTRFGFMYVPHGMIMDRWIPATEGANFEFKPIMKPLEPFRNQLTVVGNLNLGPDQGGQHSAPSGMWLNNTPHKRTEAEDVRAGTTVDQMIAAKIGQQTTFPSLELATEDLTSLVGACDSGFSCTYINTLCWSTPTTPLPMEINPRVVFERLFGQAGTAANRATRTKQQKSLLDSISQEASDLQKVLGVRDRGRVSEYLDNIREIERRIQKAEAHSTSQVTSVGAPVGVPD